jgi:hypothetical protein
MTNVCRFSTSFRCCHIMRAGMLQKTTIDRKYVRWLVVIFTFATGTIGRYISSNQGYSRNVQGEQTNKEALPAAIPRLEVTHNTWRAIPIFSDKFQQNPTPGQARGIALHTRPASSDSSRARGKRRHTAAPWVLR